MTDQKSDPPTSALHRTDLLSLIFGLLFLGVAGWWAASYYFDWTITWYLPDAGWLLAGGLILLGLIGILASLRRDRRDAPTGAVNAAGPAGAAGASMTATGPGTVAMATEPQTVLPDAPNLDRSAAGERTAELDPLPAGDARPDQPVGGDLTAEQDPPGPGDSGAQRPA